MLLLLLLRTASSWTTNPVRTVTIVGGTHGNEYTGVWCIRQWEARRGEYEKLYPSLEISTLLGNPDAHLENKRFIDTDLNREFAEERLNRHLHREKVPVEAIRAREINDLLGPKCEGEEPCTDLVLDLHTTTSNMGITLIVPEGDTLMTQAAAFVMHRCNAALGEDSCRILLHAIADRSHRPNLSSAARHGFTIEVGPVPQGVLRHDAIDKTYAALHAVLDFCERTLRGDDLLKELEGHYPDGIVPCFRSAQARRSGEMSGKISWPCHPDNPNFPLVVVHKSLQDRDFQLIHTGDPLFVHLDGSVIRYNGSHGDAVYAMFVNEGGYYYSQSGTGISVAMLTAYDLYDGRLIPCEQANAVVGNNHDADICDFDL
jgi:aspartoacylase